MTPEQEEQVRRVLAAAAGRPDAGGPGDGSRPTDPALPAEVSARLDDVLAELAAPRRSVRSDTGSDSDGEPARPGTVVPLGDGAARRRRWSQLLVAAAAVSVIAFAGGAVATGGFGLAGSGGESTSAGSSTSDDAGGSAAEPQAAPSGPDQAGGQRVVARGELRSDHLQRDVRRLLRGGGVAAFGAPRAGGEGASTSPSSPRGTGTLAGGCVAPATGAGDRLVAVRLDGRRATLLVHPVRDGTQEAQVYSCDDAGAPVASTVLPAG